MTNLTGTPKFVTANNAVRMLIDGHEAFGRIADDIKGAQSSVEMTQLFFALPPKFDQQAEKEEPALIFKFADPLAVFDPLKPNQPKANPTQGLFSRGPPPAPLRAR